jgi:hypothetical protein
MKKLRSAVEGIKGELETFGSGVSARLEAARSEIEALATGIEESIASMRPPAEKTLTELTGQIDALDAELKELKP